MRLAGRGEATSARPPCRGTTPPRPADRYRGAVSDELSDISDDTNLPQPTGVPTVDSAVERLTELDGLPTGEHVAIYDAVHRQLQDALADLDGA
jgi:hypothetical protein